MRRNYLYKILMCVMGVMLLGGCGSVTEKTLTETTAEVETAAVQKTELQQMAENMKQNLELPEYFDEAVNLMASEEWSRVVTENYTINDASGIRMDIQADKDVSVVCFYKEETTIMLKKTKEQFYVVETQSDYNGEFTAWVLNYKTGDVYHETGVFSDGILTGDYVVQVSQRGVESELFSLWNNRETMEYAIYRGYFDQEGRPEVKQLKDTGVTVYAYDDTMDGYLYAEMTDAVFSAQTMGFDRDVYLNKLLLRQTGVVKEEKVQPTQPSVQQPTQKPTQPSVQQPTQKPTQPSVQQPEQKPAQPSVPEQIEEPEMTPDTSEAAPEPPSLDESGDGSGDVDIEWSEDIL